MKLWNRMGPLAQMLVSAVAIAFTVFFVAITVVYAAVDYDQESKPFNLITVGTSADVVVTLSDHSVKITHLGLQDDGTTASASTDRLYIGMGKDTLTATIDDGAKVVLIPGASVELQGRDVHRSTDGTHVIRLRATGNECKVQLVRGR